MPEARLNEALSALMDGEVDELELRRLLRELPASPELQATWKRYHAAQASLHQELHTDPAVDLLAGIRARLAAEQEQVGYSPKVSAMLRSRMVRYFGQGAIAASVAAAALIGISALEVADTGAGTEAAMVAVIPLNTDVQTRTVAVDSEAYSHLQQAVYREFSESPERIPVSYNLEFPALTPAE